jgi:hypothetical protein
MNMATETLANSIREYDPSYQLGAEDLRIVLQVQAMSWADCQRELARSQYVSIEKFYLTILGAIGNVQNDILYQTQKLCKNANAALGRNSLWKFENREDQINRMIDLFRSRVEHPYLPRQLCAAIIAK